MTIGCHLPSNEDFRDFPPGKLKKAPRFGRGGLRTPGCLTSEDEERETWTAESLRISNTWKLRFSTFGIGRKTSAVHVLKRLHHRRQRCESRAINMVGPRQTL